MKKTQQSQNRAEWTFVERTRAGGTPEENTAVAESTEWTVVERTRAGGTR